MTRDEAIKAVAISSSDVFESLAGEHPLQTERRMKLELRTFVDRLVALGLLRLDQPKGLPQKMRDFVSDSRLVHGGVMERLDNLQAVLADHGLRIIEK